MFAEFEHGSGRFGCRRLAESERVFGSGESEWIGRLAGFERGFGCFGSERLVSLESLAEFERGFGRFGSGRL